MRIHLHAPLVRRAAALAALAAVAACEAKGGRDDYAGDADTGAAAPATVLTPSTPGTPDSTAGVSQRTGQPGVAGDRQGQNSTAAIPNTPAAGREAAGAATATQPPPKP
jgi:hypothetical protein